MSALSFALQLLGTLPSLISAGIDVVDLINKAHDDLRRMKDERRDPTAEEWDELNILIENLRAQRPDVTEEN